MAFYRRVAIWLSVLSPSIQSGRKADGGYAGSGSLQRSVARCLTLGAPLGASVQGPSAACGRSPAHHVAAPTECWDLGVLHHVMDLVLEVAYTNTCLRLVVGTHVHATGLSREHAVLEDPPHHFDELLVAAHTLEVRGLNDGLVLREYMCLEAAVNPWP